MLSTASLSTETPKASRSDIPPKCKLFSFLGSLQIKINAITGYYVNSNPYLSGNDHHTYRINETVVIYLMRTTFLADNPRVMDKASKTETLDLCQRTPFLAMRQGGILF